LMVALFREGDPFLPTHPCPERMKRRSSMDDFLALALEEAMAGIEKDDGGPFGAVIVPARDGIVISKAHNEVLKRNDPTAPSPHPRRKS